MVRVVKRKVPFSPFLLSLVRKRASAASLKAIKFADRMLHVQRTSRVIVDISANK